MKENTEFNEVAKKLAEYTFKYSVNTKYFSPFAKRAKEIVPQYGFMGGKSDDISIIFGQIVINHHWSIYIYIFIVI